MRIALLALSVAAFFGRPYPTLASDMATLGNNGIQQTAIATASKKDGSYDIGVKVFPVATPERGAEMEMTIWYPAGRGGTRTVIGGGNPLFEGTTAFVNAPIAAGMWPLVIHSQGGLRSGPNIGGWMASRLAGKGFVVAMLRQSDPAQLTEQETLPELWLRASDISAALTAILNQNDLFNRIDASRIAVLGFQVGGTAALSIAGGMLDVARVKGSCDPGAIQGVDCGRFRRANLNLHDVDMARLSRPNADSRVKAIVVVDPEFSGEFTEESLARIKVPVGIINLGKPGSIWPGLNAKYLTQGIPSARYVTVPDATQYSAFPECKPRASAILKDGGEEAICDDPVGGQSRRQIHDALAEQVATWLRSDFGEPSQAP